MERHLSLPSLSLSCCCVQFAHDPRHDWTLISLSHAPTICMHNNDCGSKRPADRLDTSPSVTHTDQYKLQLDLRKQIKVQSLGEGGLLIASKFTPESMFALTQVSQTTYKLGVNWKSNYSSWQTFCLITLLYSRFTKNIQKRLHIHHTEVKLIQMI